MKRLVLQGQGLFLMDYTPVLKMKRLVFNFY